MHIEILKFYEIVRVDEKQHLIGSLHVHLPEIGLHIKGITVFRKKQYWYFRLPSRKAFDQSLGKEIDYSCVLFDEKEKNEALLTFLKTEGRKFVEDYLLSTPEIQKPQPAPEPSKSTGQGKDIGAQQKSKEAPLKTAEPKASILKPEKFSGATSPGVASIPKPFAKLAVMDFRDPPKRSAPSTKNKYAKSTR